MGTVAPGENASLPAVTAELVSNAHVLPASEVGDEHGGLPGLLNAVCPRFQSFSELVPWCAEVNEAMCADMHGSPCLIVSIVHAHVPPPVKCHCQATLLKIRWQTGGESRLGEHTSRKHARTRMHYWSNFETVLRKPSVASFTAQLAEFLRLVTVTLAARTYPSRSGNGRAVRAPRTRCCW